MRVSIYVGLVVVVAVEVLALPTRRLRRPGGSILEIGSDKPTVASSGMVFPDSGQSFSEMMRLLEDSEATMSVTHSMSMSMTSAPSPPPSVVPAPTPPPITSAPTTNTVATMAPTTVAPVTVPPTTAAPITVPPTTAAPITVPPSTAAPITPAPTTAAPTTGAPTLPPTTIPPTLPPVRPEVPTASPPSVAPAVPTRAPVQSSSTSPTMLPPASDSSPSSSPSKFGDLHDDIIEEKCDVTPLERSRDILSILSVISDPVDLVTPGTSQFQARDWLDNMDRLVLCATETAHVGQRYRAALLYYSLGGPGWANCRALDDSDTNTTTPCLVEEVRTSRRLQELLKDESFDWKENAKDRRRRVQDATPQKVDEEESVRWLSVNNECEWFGMDCGDAYQPGDNPDDYYPLVNIDLGNNTLAGTLIQEIFGFVELQAMFLDANGKISGTIPEEVGQMTKLNFLKLDDNQVTGPLPNALFSLANMLVIDFNANQLTGTLSPAIGNITSLEILQLENNAFTGVLPTESLLNLTRLVALTLEGNLFTGTLEPLCDVRDERRMQYEIYLNFMFAECGGQDPLVECSCCVCY